MSIHDEFCRVNLRIRCPICEKHDWCMVARNNPSDPARVVCARVESPRRWGTAGWLHVRREDGARRIPRSKTYSISMPDTARMSRWHTIARDQLSQGAVLQLARGLHLTTTSLARLGVGHLRPDQLGELGLFESPAWTFPMVDARGAVIGLRLRPVYGRKFAVPGSKNGMFVPADLACSTRRLFIAEGESDTAALLDLGVDAIGRAGCKQGGRLICQLVSKLRPREVVIVADADDVGRAGASSLARELGVLVHAVRVIEPPPGIKDAREWRQAGLSTAEIERASERAPSVAVQLCAGHGGA